MLVSPLMFLVVLFALLGMRLILRAVPGQTKRQRFLTDSGISRKIALFERSTFLHEDVVLAILLNLVGLDRKRRRFRSLFCRVTRNLGKDCAPVYPQYSVRQESIKDFVPPFSEYFRE